MSREAIDTQNQANKLDFAHDAADGWSEISGSGISNSGLCYFMVLLQEEKRIFNL